MPEMPERVWLDTPKFSPGFLRVCKPEDTEATEYFRADLVPQPVASDALKGAEMIAIERRRQIDVEGYTPEHDAEHDAGHGHALCSAAWSYLHVVRAGRECDVEPPLSWPWDAHFWKPASPIRMLVKAGALIAAEIDRRLAAGETL